MFCTESVGRGGGGGLAEEDARDLSKAVAVHSSKNFIIYPLEVCTKAQLGSKERFRIRATFQRVYNRTEVITHRNAERWRMWRRIGAVEERNDTGEW